MREMRCRGTQHLPGVGDDQLTQLSGLAEGNSADAMLHTLCLQAQNDVSRLMQQVAMVLFSA